MLSPCECTTMNLGRRAKLHTVLCPLAGICLANISQESFTPSLMSGCWVLQLALFKSIPRCLRWGRHQRYCSKVKLVVLSHYSVVILSYFLLPWAHQHLSCSSSKGSHTQSTYSKSPFRSKTQSSVYLFDQTLNSGTGTILFWYSSHWKLNTLLYASVLSLVIWWQSTGF